MWGLLALGCSAPPAVEFAVFAPTVPAGQTVYVAGSPADWGGWQPYGVALQPAEGGWFRGSAPAPDGTHEFKFTLGTWDREAVKPNGFKRENSLVTVVGGAALVQDTVWAWSDGAAANEVQGQLTGRTDTLGMWAPEGLIERLVVCWVPPDTARISEVLVMHDGRNLFDPASANFGVDWGVDDTLMVWAERGEQVLVVGVDCTEERSTDYGVGPEGLRYVRGLAEELVPRVLERYGVGEEVPVTVAGASMGGLISAVAIREHPEVFDGAICMSGAFAYRDFSAPDAWRAAGWPAGLGPIWLDNGTVGLEAQLEPGIEAMAELLAEQEANHTFVVYFEGRHFEADWGWRLGTALRWIQKHRTDAH